MIASVLAWRSRDSPIPHQEGFSPDIENPAPWLSAWVKEMSPKEQYSQVFMLRMGMLGKAPITLKAVALKSGSLTRERVRQMQKIVEKKAETSYQQRRLHPLVEAAAAVVAQKNGLISLDKLTEAVLGKGQDGEQLRYATGLMIFLSKLKIWQEVGLRVPDHGVIGNMSRGFDANRRLPHGA